MTTQIVDSHLYAPHERVDAVLSLANTIVPVEIDFPERRPLVRGTVTDLGVVRLTSIRSNASRVERTPRLTHDDTEPQLMLGLQITGSSLVVQDDREVAVRPGDVVLYRSTSPYTLVDRDGYRQHQLRMPQRDLAVPEEILRRVTATRLSPGHPVTDLACTYFGRLAFHQRTFTEADGRSVSLPGMELLRAVIATHLDKDSVDARESYRGLLLMRVLEYARAHLGDPTLNAARIAAEHHISVRHLYNVLAEGDIALGDWIRQRRLEACRAELARPDARDLTIAALAQRWGFRDASNFGRVFRAEYGLSPSEWRASRAAERGDRCLSGSADGDLGDAEGWR